MFCEVLLSVCEIPHHKATKKRSFMGNQFYNKDRKTKQVDNVGIEPNSPASEVRFSELRPTSSDFRPTPSHTPMPTFEGNDPTPKGSSKMESIGVEKLFSRSEQSRGVHYLNSFATVSEKKFSVIM